MGMVAACGPFTMGFNYWMVALTVVLAIAFCTAGMVIAFAFHGVHHRVIGALVIGVAVTSVHYTVRLTV